MIQQTITSLLQSATTTELILINILTTMVVVSSIKWTQEN